MGSRRRSSIASSIDKFLRDIPKRLSSISIWSQQSTGRDIHQLPEFLQDEETEKHAFLYIREKVLEEVQEIPGELHPADIEYFKTSNDMIARFLYDYANAHVKQSMEKTCDQVCRNLLETLKWRKSVGLHDLKITDFPYELFEVFNYMHSIYIGHDGHLYFYVTAEHIANLSGWAPLIKHLIYFCLDFGAKHYAKIADKGLIDLKPICIGNASGVGISKVGLAKEYLPFALSMKTVILNHYPGYAYEGWILGLPWYAKSLFWFGLKLLPSYLQRKVKVMDFESAVEAVGIENLPKEIGGRHEGGTFFEIPQNTVSIEEAAKRHGISDRDVARMKKYVAELRKQKGKKLK